MGTLALRVTGGAKRYHREGQEQRVFDSVDLAVQHGEVFALLGPSGCGKSTLLRALAGLEPLSAGRVELGRPAAGTSCPVGIVFQEPLLLPWLTVAENVRLGLRFRANRHAARNGQAGESVDQVLRDFGLTVVADVYPNELSGGQAQRASLARTLVTQPSLLLLDEPFAALDPRTRSALQDWLLEVVRRRRLTVLLVTHDVEEALYLGDRVGLMSSRPSTITRVWETRHADGHTADGHTADGHTSGGTMATARPVIENSGVSGAPPPRRQRDDARLLAIRREILAEYQTDVPTGAARS